MIQPQITFLSAGITAGIITAVIGRLWPGFLSVGVGLLFFVALLAAITITAGWPRLRPGLWRYIVAVVICTVAYVLALFTLMSVSAYVPKLLGVPASGDLVEFGADMWIGLLAAVLVASAGVELVLYILTGTWSNSFFGRLAVAGFVSVLVTFIVNLTAHHYWSFMGVLLPVGEGLFCAVVGAQIWRTSQQAMQQA
jgi:hypothetical protein